MRERKREEKHRVDVAQSYETAGDVAMSRFAYIEATVQYQCALAENPRAEDEARVCAKVGQALNCGARPDLATPWFERRIELCRVTESLYDELPAAMRHIPHQYWLEARTQEILEYLQQARTVAVAAGNAVEIRKIDASYGAWLVTLGRYAEAEKYISPDAGKDDLDPPHAHAYGVNQYAILLATRGCATLAFAQFDRAIDLSQKLLDGYFTTIIWTEYASWALALGRSDIARACRERALFVARERRILWRIPYLTLRFAHTLIVTGEYEQAKELVEDALTYDTNTPVIRVLLSTVGAEVARILKDDGLLKRVLDNEALELALQSGESERLASIVTTYAKVSISRGQRRCAKTLIGRGVSRITRADHAGDLLVLAARYGSRSDAARARALLLERIRLPHHRVAQAYLALLEAYEALRQRANDKAYEHAQSAAKLFKRLGRKHQQLEALALGETAGGVATREDTGESKSFLGALHPGLTARERQVAELVLRGLSNRAIAQALTISEHTVETHMTSILNRMGLRSRWQLIEPSRE